MILKSRRSLSLIYQGTLRKAILKVTHLLVLLMEPDCPFRGHMAVQVSSLPRLTLDKVTSQIHAGFPINRFQEIGEA